MTTNSSHLSEASILLEIGDCILHQEFRHETSQHALNIHVATVIAFAEVFPIGRTDRGTSARDAAAQEHPFVGVWLADTEHENEANALQTFTLKRLALRA